MKIIITAAGLGSRFQKIGIKKPKYKIIAKGKSLFYWSLISLKKFFSETFIFVFRKSAFDKSFVEKELKKLGICYYKIVLINKLTDGQATTVMKCKKYIEPNDSILIYNIDTHIHPSRLNKSWLKYDGLIVTMNARGDHWSFARTAPQTNFAIEVSEKKRISPHASVGLYYFKRFCWFNQIYQKYKRKILKKWNEVYICPMYQYLIDNDYLILVRDVPVSSVVCLGTPGEVKRIDSNFVSKNI